MPKPKFDPTKPFESLDVPAGAPGARAGLVPTPSPTESMGQNPMSVKPKFDPSQPFQEVEEPKTSALEAGIQGFGNVGLMGYLPEAQSVASRLIPNPSAEVDERLKSQGFKIDQPSDQPISTDEMRSRNLQLAKEHPVAYTAGGVAGAIGTAPAYGKALGLLPGVASKTTGVLSGLKSGAIAGGALGLAQNPNTQPGEEGLNVGSRLKSGLVQGTVGGALGAAGGLISKADPEALRSNAYRQAFKSLDPKLRDVSVNKERIDDIGKTLLDTGVIGKGTKSYEEIGHSAAEALDQSGKNIDSWINKIADAAETAASGTKNVPSVGGSNVVPAAGIDKRAIVDSIKGDFSYLESLPETGGDIKKIQKVLDSFDSQHGDIIPIRKANEVKQGLGKLLDSTKAWDKIKMRQPLTPKEQAYMVLYDRLKTGVEDAAEAMSPALGPTAREEFIQAKNNYGNLKAAAKIANKSADREFANRYLSLSDYQSGELGGALGMMATAGSAPERLLHAAGGAAAGAIGNRIARTFGNQPMASANLWAAKALEKNPSLYRGLIKPAVSTAQSPPIGLLNIMNSNNISK